MADLLWQAMKKASSIYWNDPKNTEPEQAQTILVVYNDQVWPGVYAYGTKKVVLYPEDFGSVLLENCQMWAALPSIDPIIFTKLQEGQLWFSAD